jgi:hypothetical protein
MTTNVVNDDTLLLPSSRIGMKRERKEEDPAAALLFSFISVYFSLLASKDDQKGREGSRNFQRFFISKITARKSLNFKKPLDLKSMKIQNVVKIQDSPQTSSKSKEFKAEITNERLFCAISPSIPLPFHQNHLVSLPFISLVFSKQINSQQKSSSLIFIGLTENLTHFPLCLSSPRLLSRR